MVTASQARDWQARRLLFSPHKAIYLNVPKRFWVLHGKTVEFFFSTVASDSEHSGRLRVDKNVYNISPMASGTLETTSGDIVVALQQALQCSLRQTFVINDQRADS
jgi:hypothetical protein